MVAALSTNGTDNAQLDIVSQEWWIGRLLLLSLSMGMQKIPVLLLLGLFKIEEVGSDFG